MAINHANSSIKMLYFDNLAKKELNENEVFENEGITMVIKKLAWLPKN